MAEALMKHFYGHKVYVQSCGVKPGERDPFVEGGDGKLFDALLGKRLSNLNRPVPIGIGLDDGHYFAAGRQVALDAREIMGEGREIDGGVGG